MPRNVSLRRHTVLSQPLLTSLCNIYTIIYCARLTLKRCRRLMLMKVDYGASHPSSISGYAGNFSWYSMHTVSVYHIETLNLALS